MADPKLPESAAETLRRKILTSKPPLREIARESGVSAGVLSRFARGQRDVRLSTAERIADALGTRLRIVRKAKGTGKRTGTGRKA